MPSAGCSGHDRDDIIRYAFLRRESADFPGAACDKTKDGVTAVGGGTSTAEPWAGEPTNSGNKQ